MIIFTMHARVKRVWRKVEKKVEVRMTQETMLGMVLSATPVGEYDKRLVILTKEHGKIAAFARGARKPNSSLLGCSQPFSFGEFSMYVGRNSYSISSANISNYFTEFREDLDKLYYGFYFCELADYFTRENLDAKEMLKLLYQSLRALAKGTIRSDLIRYIYELKMLGLHGEAPMVFSCVACNGTDAITFFNSRRNGMICKKCAMPLSKEQNGIPVKNATIYTMQYILTSSIEKLYTFTVKDEIFDELKKCITTYMADHIRHPFHSLELLDE